MRRVLLVFLLVTWILVTGNLAYSDVKLKVAVVNPSDVESQTTPVRYDLPKGMAPEDITDIGQMELKYDFDKGNYYLSQIVRLKPSEKVVMEIKLRDIWMIPRKDIDFLKNHTNSLATRLEKTRHAKVGQGLAKKITDRLDAISKSETDPGLTISDHINLYYENMGILTEVKEDIGMLENLVIDVGGIVEERVQVPATLAVPIKASEVDKNNIIDLTVRASNPSQTKKQVTNVKYILPEEVAPRYVVDRDELELGYDFAKQSFYVYKDNVTLNPSETKTYILKIMDIWKIPDVDMDTLRAHMANLMLLLKGTEYLEQAKVLADGAGKNLDEIRKSQALKTSPDDHIAYYRKNSLLLSEVKKAVAQLEKFASQAGASVGVTIKEAEVQRGGGPKEKRARGYEGIDYIVKSIFRGRAPTVATTWKIIYTILIFIGLLGAIFFGLWYTQIKRGHREEKK